MKRKEKKQKNKEIKKVMEQIGQLRVAVAHHSTYWSLSTPSFTEV